MKWNLKKLYIPSGEKKFFHDNQKAVGKAKTTQSEEHFRWYQGYSFMKYIIDTFFFFLLFDIRIYRPSVYGGRQLNLYNVPNSKINNEIIS